MTAVRVLRDGTYEELVEDRRRIGVRCRRCGTVTLDPDDVRLLRCPECGYHPVYRAVGSVDLQKG